jgi:hypothetical protein
MPTNNYDANEFSTLGVDAADFDGFDHVLLEDGDVIIYDRDHEDAWIQSDDYIQAGMML